MNSKAETTWLKELWNSQPTKAKKEGFAFEVLGYKARRDIARKYEGLGFIWTGLTAYLRGEEAIAGGDFIDAFGDRFTTDEYKNTNGRYYLSQYVKEPDKDHYTVGRVPSDDATENYLRSHGKSCLIIGQQIDDFPLKDKGTVKRKFRAAYNAIKSDLMKRLGILLSSAFLSSNSCAGISNSQSFYCPYPIINNVYLCNSNYIQRVFDDIKVWIKEKLAAKLTNYRTVLGRIMNPIIRKPKLSKAPLRKQAIDAEIMKSTFLTLYLPISIILL